MYSGKVRGQVDGKRNWIGNFVRVSCLGISLVFCVVGYAQSETPAPSGGEKQQPTAQKPKEPNNQPGIMSRGTETTPLVITISGTPVIKMSPGDYAKQTESKAAEWSTAVIALFALGVAYWQLRCFRRQLGLMATSMADFRQSIALQFRTNVSVEIADFVFPLEKPMSFSLVCFNHGNSPALELCCRTTIKICGYDDEEWKKIPDTWPWDQKLGTAFPHRDFKDAERKKIVFPGPFIISPAQVTEIIDKKKRIVIAVQITYKDAFKNQYFTGEFFEIRDQSNIGYTIRGGSTAT